MIDAGRPRTPAVSADVIIHLAGRSRRGIVLVQRKHPPLGWALPGGFVEVGETVEQAAVREAAEETGLSVTLDALLGVYSAPDRDPRGHVVSVVFSGTGRGEPRGGDDAAAARVFSLGALPTPMAFDHARIVEDYARLLENPA